MNNLEFIKNTINNNYVHGKMFFSKEKIFALGNMFQTCRAARVKMLSKAKNKSEFGPKVGLEIITTVLSTQPRSLATITINNRQVFYKPILEKDMYLKVLYASRVNPKMARRKFNTISKLDINLVKKQFRFHPIQVSDLSDFLLELDPITNSVLNLYTVISQKEAMNLNIVYLNSDKEGVAQCLSHLSNPKIIKIGATNIKSIIVDFDGNKTNSLYFVMPDENNVNFEHGFIYQKNLTIDTTHPKIIDILNKKLSSRLKLTKKTKSTKKQDQGATIKPSKKQMEPAQEQDINSKPTRRRLKIAQNNNQENSMSDNVVTNQEENTKPNKKLYRSSKQQEKNLGEDKVVTNPGLEDMLIPTGKRIIFDVEDQERIIDQMEEEQSRITKDIQKMIDTIYIHTKKTRGESTGGLISNFQGMGRKKIFQYLNIRSFKDDIAPSFFSVLPEEYYNRYCTLKSDYKIISDKIQSTRHEFNLDEDVSPINLHPVSTVPSAAAAKPEISYPTRKTDPTTESSFEQEMNYPAPKFIHKLLVYLLNTKFDFVDSNLDLVNGEDETPLESLCEQEINYPTSKSVHKQLASLLNRRFVFADQNRNLVDGRPLESSCEQEMNHPASKSVHKRLASLLNRRFNFADQKRKNKTPNLNLVDGQSLESLFEEEMYYPTSKSVHKQLAYILNRRFDFVDPTRKGQTPNLNLVDQEGKEKPLESSFDKNYESKSGCLDPKLELKSNTGHGCF